MALEVANSAGMCERHVFKGRAVHETALNASLDAKRPHGIDSKQVQGRRMGRKGVRGWGQQEGGGFRYRSMPGAAPYLVLREVRKDI